GYSKLDRILEDAIGKFKRIKIDRETRIYRIKRDLEEDICISNADLFDPVLSHKKSSGKPRDRFSAAKIPIFYGAFDIDTCLYEIHPGFHEELTLGIFEPKRELNLINFEELIEDFVGEDDDLPWFMSRLFYGRDYELNSLFSL